MLAGKSGGGRSFGYDLGTSLDASEASVAGERKIDGADAEVVREIFRRFAAGEGRARSRGP